MLLKKLIPEDFSRDKKPGVECLPCQWPSECVFYNLRFQTVITTSSSTIFIYLSQSQASLSLFMCFVLVNSNVKTLQYSLAKQFMRKFGLLAVHQVLLFFFKCYFEYSCQEQDLYFQFTIISSFYFHNPKLPQT